VKKLAIGVVALLFLWIVALPAAHADNVQDAEINIGGTTISGEPIVSGGGVDASGFNNSTGLGTITITVLGGCGASCYADVWLFDPASVVDYNEYGQVGGTLASGQSWQIDVPDYDSDSNITGTILANTDANTLNDKNNVPGTVDNFLGTCSGPSCNDLVSLALGFNFADPGAGNEEIITLSVSTTSCLLDSDSICLEDTHPQDPGSAGSAYFMSGTAVSQAICNDPSCMPPPPPPGAPEPSTLLMMAGSLSGLLMFRRKAFSAN